MTYFLPKPYFFFICGLFLIFFSSGCAPIGFYNDVPISFSEKELERLKGNEIKKEPDIQDIKNENVIFFNVNGGERVPEDVLKKLQSHSLKNLQNLQYFGKITTVNQIEEQFNNEEKYRFDLFSQAFYELGIPEKNFIRLIRSKAPADYLLLLSMDDALAPYNQYYLKLALYDLRYFAPVWIGTELREIENTQKGLEKITDDLFFVLAQRLNRSKYQERFQSLSEI